MLWELVSKSYFFVSQGYFSFFFSVRVHLLIVVIKRTIKSTRERNKNLFLKIVVKWFPSPSLCIFQLCQRQLTTGMQARIWKIQSFSTLRPSVMICHDFSLHLLTTIWSFSAGFLSGEKCQAIRLCCNERCLCSIRRHFCLSMNWIFVLAVFRAKCQQNQWQ